MVRARAWLQLGTVADLDQALLLTPEDPGLMVVAARGALQTGDLTTGRQRLERLIALLERREPGYSTFTRSGALRECLLILGRVDATVAGAFRERFRELGVLHD